MGGGAKTKCERVRGLDEVFLSWSAAVVLLSPARPLRAQPRRDLLVRAGMYHQAGHAALLLSHIRVFAGLK